MEHNQSYSQAFTPSPSFIQSAIPLIKSTFAYVSLADRIRYLPSVCIEPSNFHVFSSLPLSWWVDSCYFYTIFTVPFSTSAEYLIRKLIFAFAFFLSFSSSFSQFVSVNRMTNLFSLCSLWHWFFLLSRETRFFERKERPFCHSHPSISH